MKIGSNIKRWRNGFMLFVMLLMFFPVQAQLPLITDNTGVQGKGKGQIEVSNGLGFHNEHRCIENSSEILPQFAYGIHSKCDLVAGYPFLVSSVTVDSFASRIAGFSDLSVELKYQVFKRKHLSFALKPGITLPTGRYSDGLGSGRVSGTLFCILTAEYPGVTLSGNAGYLRNENRCGDALNIWHASLDADKKLNEQFHFVCNAGAEKSPNPSESVVPVFALLGVYYCLSESCELSLGYERDFILKETHHSFIYGITLRF